jgi:hypothetical protein
METLHVYCCQQLSQDLSDLARTAYGTVYHDYDIHLYSLHVYHTVKWFVKNAMFKTNGLLLYLT